MTPVVIDTNVLLVANGSHQEVSDESRAACVRALLARKESGMVVIDDGYRILGEYQNRTYPNQPKGVGDAFLKWLDWWPQLAAQGILVHLLCPADVERFHAKKFPERDPPAWPPRP